MTQICKEIASTKELVDNKGKAKASGNTSGSMLQEIFDKVCGGDGNADDPIEADLDSGGNNNGGLGSKPKNVSLTTMLLFFGDILYQQKIIWTYLQSASQRQWVKQIGYTPDLGQTEDKMRIKCKFWKKYMTLREQISLTNFEFWSASKVEK